MSVTTHGPKATATLWLATRLLATRLLAARLRSTIWLATILALAVVPSPLPAQQPRLPVNKLAADMVRLEGGTRLYGVLVDRDEVGNLRLLVDRQWLQRTEPKYFSEVVEREASARAAARRTLLERIDAWRRERSGDVGMQVFLDGERKRLTPAATPDEVATDEATDGATDGAAAGDEAADDEADEAASDVAESLKRDEPPLMLVELLADEVASGYRQPEARRRLLLKAFHHRIPRAVTRSPAALASELHEKGIDLQTPTPPWTSMTRSVAVVENERQWAARQALVEYRRRQPLNFQAAGGYIARTGAGGDEIALEELMGHVLSDQLRSQLAALTGEKLPAKNETLKKAVEVAEKEGVRGFRIARLEQDAARQRATVTYTFYAKMPDGQWTEVLFAQGVKQASDVKKETLEGIAASPDIRKMTELLKGVGTLGGGDTVEKALAFGAATKEAMQAAQLAFLTKLNPLVRTLDVPLPPIAAIPAAPSPAGSPR